MRLTRVVSVLTSGICTSTFLSLFLRGPILFGAVISEQFDVEDLTSESMNVTCNPMGSKSLVRHPNFGTCLCKDNVIGEFCDTCKPGTIDLQESHEKGCIECICSNVTKVCHLEEFPLARVRPPPKHGLVLLRITSGAEKRIKDGIVTNQVANLASYNLTEAGEEFYWELPFEFIANKITAYGQNFQWTQNYLPSSVFNPNLLIIGTEGTLVWTGESNSTDVTNETFSVQLDEVSLRKLSDHVAVKADRLDVMRVLASIESIRIRACGASTESNQINLFIANITMEVAITDNKPLIHSELVTSMGKIEVCQCPFGYTGTSCETCGRGYFKSRAHSDDLEECKKCPCNDREVDCWLTLGDDTPYCNCLFNYTGANCEEVIPPPLVIEGPSNITTQKGSSVKLGCKIANTSGTFKEWLFEPGVIPPGVESNLEFPRKKQIYGTNLYKDDYTLELRDVTVKHEGWYTCKIINPVGMDERRAYLRVLNDYLISEGPINTTVTVGSSVNFSCGSLNNKKTYRSWMFRSSSGWNHVKEGSLQKQLSQNWTENGGSILQIDEVTYEDEGWYTCQMYHDDDGFQKVSAYLRVIERSDKSKYHVVTEQCLRIATVLLCFLFSLVLIPITLLWCLKRRARRRVPVIKKRKILEKRNNKIKTKEQRDSAHSTDTVSNNAPMPPHKLESPPQIPSDSAT